MPRSMPCESADRIFSGVTRWSRAAPVPVVALAAPSGLSLYWLFVPNRAVVSLNVMPGFAA